MAHVKFRLTIHAIAFLLGAFQFHWSLMGPCIFAHHFLSPAQAAEIERIDDIDELRTNGSDEQILMFARHVRIMTLHSSIISGVWYLVGLGLGYLF